MEDHQLIQQVLNGNQDAYRFLYRMHSQSAWNLAMSLCKQSDIAEDVVQNSFVNAYRFLKHFRGESSFKTWLMRIVYNESFKQLKKEKLVYRDVSEEIEESPTDWKWETKLETQETKHHIQNCLAQMKDSESLLLRLFYLEELNIKELSEITGFSEGNVKVILHRARKNFKQLFEKNVI